MNLTRKKPLRTFFKNNFWNVKVKEYSSTLSVGKGLNKQFYDKIKNQDAQSSRFYDKNKILDSLLSSEISPYINPNKFSLLKTYLTFKRDFLAKYSFVADSEIAKDIVDKILPELKQERSYVIEANPGLGLITLNLIKCEVPKIHIYENSKLRSISLEQLINKYPDRLQLESQNIFIPKKNNFIAVLDNSLKLNVNNKIIGIIQESNFFTNLIQECVTCSLWDSIQMTNFFLIVTKKIWKNVFDDTETRSRYFTYCFFNLIFETELLAEYPSSAFLPYSFHFGEDKMFFVKISKRSNFPGEFCEEEINSLLNLCKVLGRKKFNYIIPTLEQWVPECGPYLISKGISVTTLINDLSYDEFLKLYVILKKFKGFKNFGLVN